MGQNDRNSNERKKKVDMFRGRPVVDTDRRLGHAGHIP